MKPLPPPDQMPLNSPQIGPDGATYVKLYVQDAPGASIELVHNLGREPFSLLPVWSNKAINYPEVVSSTKEKTVLKFVPDWVSAYTQKKFIVVMRIQ
jgi:hypothetical protein